MEETDHWLIHLSGPHRGSIHVLEGTVVRAGTGSDVDLHFPSNRAPSVASLHGQLRRVDAGWRVEPRGDAAVSVNGDPTDGRRLEAGDVVELGSGGPLLRYQTGRGPGAYKSLREAWGDCVACARYGATSRLRRAAVFLQAMPREMFLQTAPWTRAAVMGSLLLTLGVVGYLVVQGRQLDRRLDAERSRLRAVAETLETERNERRISPALLDSLRSVVGGSLPSEEAAAGDLIEDASRSVIFIQGSFSFVDPETGEQVRIKDRPGQGRGIQGRPRVGTEVDGEPLRRNYTGTGFVVTRSGYVITNRHVVRPWRKDRVARSLGELGYEPRLRRLVGYLPERVESFELRLLAASDSADLALLTCSELTENVEPLRLATEPPDPGDPVYVLGYPTGIRALLARSSPDLVGAVRQDSGVDFWSVARQLSAAGQIAPLATRGIVGQITSSAVVYDAQTTQGGSGGPVLNADGRVVAVNRAVMEGFGGSNLGVPVEFAHRLLDEWTDTSP